MVCLYQRQLQPGQCQKVLDDDHYGLDDIKDRIMEHLMVLKLRKHTKAPIFVFGGSSGRG